MKKWLVFILRFDAFALSFALPAVFLTDAFIASTHEQLGMGPYPGGAVTEYMARSLAAMYFMRGVLVWLVAGRPLEHVLVVRYLGVTNVVLGIALVAIDWVSGMPWWWTGAEGPGIAIVGGIILFLLRGARREQAASATASERGS